MKIKILYEDKDILAIDKPVGLSVHSDGRAKGKTLVDWILKNYPKMAGIGEPKMFEEKEIPRPGIVHRLDRETSGVLILAKNKKSYDSLKEQFSAPALEMRGSGLSDKKNRINKTYHTVVSGWFKEDRGTINKAIGRSPTDFRRRLAGRGARGELRDAITEYTVLKKIEDRKGNKFTYLEVRPKTGRTHQIRVHMKYLNHPVVGDSLYNPDGLNMKDIDRMMLHAKSIKFRNLKGEIMKVESALPIEFENLIK